MGIREGQFMQLGNLTSDPNLEHAHTHYLPTTDNDIVLTLENGDKLVIKDDRYGKPTNLNPKEGYNKIARGEEINRLIIKTFRDNIINIHDLKEAIIETLRNKGLNAFFVSNMEAVICDIINRLNITFI